MRLNSHIPIPAGPFHVGDLSHGKMPFYGQNSIFANFSISIGLKLCHMKKPWPVGAGNALTRVPGLRR
jgi:hypothetical protein